MKKDPRIYLLHMRDAVASIEEYTKKGESYFMKDEKTQDAVIYNLAIIGEASKKLPLSMRQAYASIPWKSIAAVRNIVIHEYDTTEIPKIWRIVERDIPVLKAMIERILEELGEEGTVA